MRYLLILTSLFLLSSPVLSASKPKFAVSIPPIASLVKMVVMDLADIEVIQKIPSCPHHAHLKPSEVFNLKNADYLVIIDDNFETSIGKYIKNSKAKKIQISGFEGLRLENNNFHIWLDLGNAYTILTNIKELLIKEGFNKEKLEQNYLFALARLKELNLGTQDSKVLIIGESLYYLLPKGEASFFALNSSPSFKRLTELKAYLINNNIDCIIHDKIIKADFLLNFYQNNLTELDIETWEVPYDLTNFYINYISKIHARVRNCLKP